MKRTRPVKALATWAIAAAGLRLFVAQPEHCPTPTTDGVRHAVDETIDWAARSQAADGRWIYRYDADADADSGFYEMVRHAGLIMALTQAEAAGFARARAPIERANAYARTQVLRQADWIALDGADGTASLEVGASALWLVALSFEQAPDTETIRGLAHFLARNVSTEGAVAEVLDLRSGPAFDRHSPFYTGETWWALTRADRLLPNEGWGAVADRISGYVATARDDAERWFPPLPDHWASYALAETILRRPLEPSEVRYAKRVAELESVQIRYESQRTGRMFSVLTRGHQAIPAGLGAMTEALGALWRVSAHESSLASSRAVLAERTRCAAGLLVQRQTDSGEAHKFARPDLVQGTWMKGGETQIDDQQHSLSGLLATLEILK